MKTILIIDNNQLRRRAMVETFANLPETRVFGLTFLKKNRELFEYNAAISDWGQQVAKPYPHMDLFLLHGRNFSYKDHASYGVRIWYGGFTGPDPKAENGDHSFMRPMEHSEDVPSPKEAQEILDFATGVISEEPKILLPLDYSEIRENIFTLIKMMLREDVVPSSTQYKRVVQLVKAGIKISDFNLEDQLSSILSKPKNPRPPYRIALAKLRDALLNASMTPA